jgi:hypothetical protein
VPRARGHCGSPGREPLGSRGRRAVDPTFKEVQRARTILPTAGGLIPRSVHAKRRTPEPVMVLDARDGARRGLVHRHLHHQHRRAEGDHSRRRGRGGPARVPRPWLLLALPVEPDLPLEPRLPSSPPPGCSANAALRSRCARPPGGSPPGAGSHQSPLPLCGVGRARLAASAQRSRPPGGRWWPRRSTHCLPQPVPRPPPPRRGDRAAPAGAVPLWAGGRGVSAFCVAYTPRPENARYESARAAASDPAGLGHGPQSPPAPPRQREHPQQAEYARRAGCEAGLRDAKWWLGFAHARIKQRSA